MAALTKQGTASAKLARSRARQISKDICIEVELGRTIIYQVFNHHISVLQPTNNTSAGWEAPFKELDTTVRPISQSMSNFVPTQVSIKGVIDDGLIDKEYLARVRVRERIRVVCEKSAKRVENIRLPRFVEYLLFYLSVDLLLLSFDPFRLNKIETRSENSRT